VLRAAGAQVGAGSFGTAQGAVDFSGPLGQGGNALFALQGDRTNGRFDYARQLTSGLPDAPYYGFTRENADGARGALERTVEEIAHIKKAICDNATFVVLSDHGFVPVEKEVAPQVALEQEGLFARNAAGALELKKLGAIHAGGSFAVYWLRPPTKGGRRALAHAVSRIRDTSAVAEVLDRKALRALGADPDAELILDAAPGFYFSDRTEGPLLCDSSVRNGGFDRGAHGHLPSHAGLRGCFIAVGPGIKRGKNLRKISLTQVAPTLAKILGLPARRLASKARAINLA